MVREPDLRGPTSLVRWNDGVVELRLFNRARYFVSRNPEDGVNGGTDHDHREENLVKHLERVGDESEGARLTGRPPQ